MLHIICWILLRNYKILWFLSTFWLLLDDFGHVSLSEDVIIFCFSKEEPNTRLNQMCLIRRMRSRKWLCLLLCGMWRVNREIVWQLEAECLLCACAFLTIPLNISIKYFDFFIHTLIVSVPLIHKSFERISIKLEASAIDVCVFVYLKSIIDCAAVKCRSTRQIPIGFYKRLLN